MIYCLNVITITKMKYNLFNSLFFGRLMNFTVSLLSLLPRSIGIICIEWKWSNLSNYIHDFLNFNVLSLVLDAMWEVWRRIEGRMSTRDPSVLVCIDLDKITVDLRPSDVEAIANVRQMFKVFCKDEVIQERVRALSKTTTLTWKLNESNNVWNWWGYYAFIQDFCHL